jgi:hypothetical protein
LHGDCIPAQQLAKAGAGPDQPDLGDPDVAGHDETIRTAYDHAKPPNWRASEPDIRHPLPAEDRAVIVRTADRSARATAQFTDNNDTITSPPATTRRGFTGDHHAVVPMSITAAIPPSPEEATKPKQAQT